MTAWDNGKEDTIEYFLVFPLTNFWRVTFQSAILRLLFTVLDTQLT